MFVGRERERAALERAYEGREAAFIPIYGRRRVGKSELILRFLEGKPAIYYLGKQAPPGLQMQELAREAAARLDEPLLAQIRLEGWRELLLAIEERHRGDGKLVIAIDEFQWVCGASPELPSVLQELWDRRWRASGRVMLILCGSYVGFMEREVLGEKSPLFGRRTAQILLRPFDHIEAARFHPKWSNVDRARARFLVGGVPMYLMRFDPDRSIEQNIEAELLGEFAPLRHEPEFLLREELREVQLYHAVLRAIADGRHGQTEIARASDIPERSVHYYLTQLIELGYVARRYPLSRSKPSARAVRYTIDDPLLRFWFRFVFPNLTYLTQMGAARAFKDRIKPELDSYFGGGFERLCREALGGLYAEEGVSAAFEVGEYWDKDVQIDVVGVRDDGWTDLGECKWGSVRSAKALAAELEAKVPKYPNPENATIGRRFFVRKKPSGALPDGRWASLDELYELG
ncbi:MAG: ATP-binding protein [Sandaracinaceae bacterium]